MSINDDKPLMVELNVQIGGDLPESKLKSFVNKISRLYEHEYRTPKGLKQIKSIITAQINCLDNAPLDFRVSAPNGDLDGTFIMDCYMDNLSLSVFTPPFVDSNGYNKNESVILIHHNLGVKNPWVVPTDGEKNPTTLVEDVYSVLNEILTAYEQPIKQAPLDMNDTGIDGDIARRKMAGEPLRKILMDVMKSQIGYPDLAMPPFKVIKGK
jgi:hypothetical protein